MEFLLKMIPAGMRLMFLSMLLMAIGTELKNKDANNTGKDDAVGNIMLSFAPAVMAFDSNNESAFKKLLRVVYDAIGKYLNE